MKTKIYSIICILLILPSFIFTGIIALMSVELYAVSGSLQDGIFAKFSSGMLHHYGWFFILGVCQIMSLGITLSWYFFIGVKNGDKIDELERAKQAHYAARDRYERKTKEFSRKFFYEINDDDWMSK